MLTPLSVLIRIRRIRIRLARLSVLTLTLALTMVLLMGATPAKAVTAQTQVPPVLSPAGYLDQTINEMTKQDQITGAIAAVVDPAGVQLNRGYGQAVQSAGLQANAETTAFRIGSVSKTFVAIAVLQQVEAGTLDLDTPIQTYLASDFPPFKQDITLHQLLTHTAGFEDLISGIVIWHPTDAAPLSDCIRRHRPEQVFEPGTVVSYSNYGIALAAYVVECVTGEDFSMYMTQHLFQPLGMLHTTFDLDPAKYGIEVAQGYRTDGQPGPEPLIQLYPEGSAVSTANDMARYLSWLLADEGPILSPESKQQLWSRQFAMAESIVGMGYTWNRKVMDDDHYVEKTGSTTHFRSWIACYPEQKTGVFVAFNTPVPEPQLETLYQMMSAVVLGNNPLPWEFGLTPEPGSPETAQSDLFVDTQSSSLIDIQSSSLIDTQSSSLIDTQSRSSIDTASSSDPIQSGYYVATRSNFTGLEKLYTLLMPERQMTITGNLTTGYRMDGQPIQSLSDRSWVTPRGRLTPVTVGRQHYLASTTALTWVRSTWLNHWVLHMLLMILFMLVTLISFLKETNRRLFHRNDPAGRWPRLTCVLACAQAGLLLGLIGLIAQGIQSINLQAFAHSVPWISALLILTAFGSTGTALFNALNRFDNSLKPIAIVGFSARFLVTIGFAWVLANQNMI